MKVPFFSLFQRFSLLLFYLLFKFLTSFKRDREKEREYKRTMGGWWMHRIMFPFYKIGNFHMKEPAMMRCIIRGAPACLEGNDCIFSVNFFSFSRTWWVGCIIYYVITKTKKNLMSWLCAVYPCNVSLIWSCY